MKKYTNYIVLLVVIAVFVVIDFAAWNKFAARRASLQEEIDVIGKKIDLAEKIDVSDKEFNACSQTLITDFFNFKQKIEKIANEQGILIQSIKPYSTETRNELFAEIKVNLSVNCTYPQLSDFISLLESNATVGVERIGVEGKEKDDEQLEVTVTLVGLSGK